MKFLDINIEELLALGMKHQEEYLNAEPFPNIYFDNFFNADALRKVMEEFPDLEKGQDIFYSNPNEIKYASRGEYKFGEVSRIFAHFLNSQPFLEFLTNLTGIKALIPDPYFEGGGFHQIKKGGFLKLHADFNKHRMTNLDRRLNVLVYLNENWEESFGGHFELWDTDMKGCVKKLLPIFNRMAIFSTTDFSYHGHPDPLNCPEDRSRRSMAFYYYSNGRPAHEINTGKERITTVFVSREGQDSGKMKFYNKLQNIALQITPPIVFTTIKNMKDRMNK